MATTMRCRSDLIVIRNWERKVQLGEMNVKRLRKELEQMTTPR
jgi:hypothetical protein